MRKLFTLFTLCLLASVAWAGEVVFVAGTDNGTGGEDEGQFTVEKEGVKLDISKGAIRSSQYRIFKTQTLTISSTAGTITQVVFECTANDDAQYGPGCFTAVPDTYTYSGKIGTWTGAAESIVFSTSNQVRATKITVTTSASGLAAPAFSPKGGTYYEPFQVTITCASQGAKIYYTTDGNDPTTASTQYSAPISVNGEMTIKAISAKDDKTSDVVSATYKIATPVVVNSIAEYQALENGTAAKFGNAVNVLAQNKGYLYVQDNSGAALFYGDCGQTYVNGDKIPAGFYGTKTTYAGEPELQWLDGFKATAGNSPIAATAISADQVAHPMFARYVSMDGVTIAKSEDGKSYILTDKDGKTCAVYFGSMGVSAPASLDGHFNVKGVVGSYGQENTIYQLLPTELTVVFDKPLGLGDLATLPDDTETAVTLTYEATVLGHSGSYLYLMDETGYGLVYGSVGKTYKQGDVIPAGYSGIKKTYDMEPELSFVKDGIQLTGFGNPIKNIGELDNEAIAIADLTAVNHDNWGKYVKIKVKVDGSNLVDEKGNTIGFYKRFDCVYPTENDDFCTVYAIVGSYKTNYQLLPYKFDIQIHTTPVESIEELYGKDAGTYGKFTTPLTAVYQNDYKNYLYVKDANNKVSLVYGTLTETFVNGDIINDAVATWAYYPAGTTYQQMTPIDESFVKAGHGATVKPTAKTIENISQNDMHNYLRIENVQITATDDAKKFNMVDEDDENILLYNQFGLKLPAFEEGKTYDVEGFLSIYKNEREILPIKVTEHGSFLKGDVNGDGSVNISDINVLISIILGAQLDEGTMKRADVNEDGSINISDVNEVIAIILK